MLSIPTVADARTEVLRWQNADPNPDRINGFVVYYGPESRLYDASIDIGWPLPTAERVFSYDLEVEDDATVYVAVTAYDGELESVFSNEQIRPVPEPSMILQLVSGGVGLAWLYRRRTSTN
jgi:hypothetical protein